MTGNDDADAGGSDEPFGDLLDEIDRKRRGDREDPSDETEPGEEVSREQTTASSGDVFSEEPFNGFDTDELWETIEEDGQSDETVGHDPHGGPGADAEARTHVVPKRSFCENCPHLTDPPEFRCTHDGSAVIEFVDRDHVRVRNCPIVEDRGPDADD